MPDVSVVFGASGGIPRQSGDARAERTGTQHDVLHGPALDMSRTLRCASSA